MDKFFFQVFEWWKTMNDENEYKKGKIKINNNSKVKNKVQKTNNNNIYTILKEENN